MKRAHVILLMLGLLVGACGQNDSQAPEGEGPGEPGPGGYSPKPGDKPAEPDDDDGSVESKPGVTPINGATEFISADSQAGNSGSRGSLGGEEFSNADAAQDPSAENDDGGAEFKSLRRAAGSPRCMERETRDAYRWLSAWELRELHG